MQTSMAYQEAIRLFQRRPEVKPIKEFWYMEVPSCTEWALNTAMNRFQPNTWVEVGKEGVDAKVKALLHIADVRQDVCMRRRLKWY